MSDKFYVTNYDRDEIIEMIRESFRDELKALIEELQKKKDWDDLLTRREAAEMLKVSLVTISKYQKEGILPFARIGRYIYFKKGDIMEAIDNQIKNKHRYKWSM